MTIFTITNAKGGVAASTSTVNIGHWFALHKRSTLIMDIDRQSDDAKFLGLPCGRNATDYLDHEHEANEVIVETGRANLGLVPGDGSLVMIERILHERSLLSDTAIDKTAGRLRAAGNGYEFLLLDPSKYGKLQEAAIQAADVLIVPTMLDYASAANTVSMVTLGRRLLHDEARIIVLPIGLDARRTRAQSEVIDQLKTVCRGAGVLTMVAEGIPSNAAIENAGKEGKTIWEYDDKSPAAVGYDSFCRWLLTIIERGGRHA